MLDGIPGIRVESLDFSYSDGEKKVLNGFTHNFLPGSLTVVIGETGTGKSTFLRLILALLSPVRQFLCFHSAGTFLRSVFFCCNGFPATEMLFHPCCFPPACFLPYPAIGLIRRIAIRRKTNASATNKSVETAIHP